MSKFLMFAKKSLIALVVIASAAAFLPVTTASAQGEEPPVIDYARLEEAYDKLLDWYNHQTEWMDKADATIARAQELIDKATARGYDASAVQAALDSFSALYPQARPYNLEAGVILGTHAGFDAGGNVTDPETAVETLKSLQAALSSAYETMGGENHAGTALIEAVKVFLESIRPNAAVPAA